jgi:hypothetical protein
MMVATQKTTRAKIADEAEQDRYLNSGIGYHLRHTVSGRWYCGRGRYSGDRRATFAGRRDARRAVGGYFRKTESAFLEMVPFRIVSPAKGHEEEAARLLAVGPEPLVPKT